MGLPDSFLSVVAEQDSAITEKNSTGDVEEQSGVAHVSTPAQVPRQSLRHLGTGQCTVTGMCRRCFPTPEMFANKCIKCIAIHEHA